MPKILRLLLVLTCAFAWSSWGDVVCTGTANSCAAASSTADPLSLANITATTANCGGAAAGAANSVCLSANTLTAEGGTADAFETLFAFGDATADQTLTCTGAASSLGCVVASPAVPANGTTAGNALAFTASPAIPNAGAGSDGAAAGGSITLTPGSAARDTSGNAAGGDVIIGASTGIGTGIAGGLAIQDGVLAAPALRFVSDADTGVYLLSSQRIGFTQNGVLRGLFHTTGFNADSLVLGLATGDAGLTRDAAGLVRVSNGATGLGALTHGLSVETVATTKAPALTESAELYTNGADTDGQAITLPNDPTAGVCYEFALTAANVATVMSIAANTGETLRQGAVTCGTIYSAAALGSTSRICAVAGGSGGVWQVMYDYPAAAWTCTP